MHQTEQLRVLIKLQYDMYKGIGVPVVSSSASPSASGTGDKAAKPVIPKEEAKKSDEGVAPANPGISEAASQPPRVVQKQEKVEYRDQDGNLLNDEQVAALQGKVEFKTQYETRVRVVDENGNEIEAPEGGWGEEIAGVAPPHPDVEGVDQSTVKGGDGDPPPMDSVRAQDAAASRDGEREAEQAKAKPASEGRDATARDEL